MSTGKQLDNFLSVVVESRSKKLLMILIGFILGVGLSSFWFFDIFILFVVGLSLIFGLMVFWQNKNSRLLLFLSLFFILGMARFQLSVPDFDDSSKIYFYNDQEVKFIATVVNIDERINYQKLTVESEIINQKQQSVGGKVLVNTGLYPKYNYGDKLSINCHLKSPERIENFDYEKYLARYGVYSVCSFARVEKIGYGEDWLIKIWSPVHRTKQGLSSSINKSIIEPQASILQAMILGNRRGISQEWLDSFSNVGVSHIIAISGMHIAIIAMIIMYLCFNIGIPRSKAFWVVVISLVLYILMIGVPASAVRAGIMAALVLYAQKIGRLGNSVNALILAVAIMLLANPKLLLFDIGFQLSFMAVVGIIYVFPILKKYSEKLPDTWHIKEMVLVTLSAQATTLPLIIFYFNKLSLISIIANVLILPILPAIMIVGIATSIVGMFSIFFGQLVGYLSWLLVSYLLLVVEYLDRAPFGYFEVAGMNVVMMIGWYAVVGWWVWRAL